MIHVGDALAILRTLADESVQCCCTSPPYWGLRDYGTATWAGGDAGCDHRKVADPVAGLRGSGLEGGKSTNGHQQEGFKSVCGKCGATRIDAQMGLEATPAEYVTRMVEVFEEVRRVLRADGTCWLNLGDSYAGGGNYRGIHSEDSLTDKQRSNGGACGVSQALGAAGKSFGVGVKNLVGIPWRMAFALQDAGWYLRSDIIWSKANPMPESVTDRPTKSHEYLFLLSKSARYFYDADAIAEPAASAYDPDDAKSPDGWDTGPGAHGTIHREGREPGRSGNKARRPASDRGVPVDTNGSTNGAVAGSVPWEGVTRNARTVWTIATAPYPEAHFATFPPEIPRRCILAGSRHGDTVLDPFAGAGTTGLVASRLGREFVGIELNPTYAELARRRIYDDAPLLNGHEPDAPAVTRQPAQETLL